MIVSNFICTFRWLLGLQLNWKGPRIYKYQDTTLGSPVQDSGETYNYRIWTDSYLSWWIQDDGRQIQDSTNSIDCCVDCSCIILWDKCTFLWFTVFSYILLTWQKYAYSTYAPQLAERLHLSTTESNWIVSSNSCLLFVYYSNQSKTRERLETWVSS